MRRSWRRRISAVNAHPERVGPTESPAHDKYPRAGSIGCYIVRIRGGSEVELSKQLAIRRIINTDVVGLLTDLVNQRIIGAECHPQNAVHLKSSEGLIQVGGRKLDCPVRCRPRATRQANIFAGVTQG